MSSVYSIAEENTYDARSDQKQMKTPKKKIGFFKKWLLSSVKEAVDQERREANLVSSPPDIISSKSLRGLQTPASIDQPDRAIHFTVYVANGGRIVETRRVDRKTDRSTNGLYIITNDQDFGREIDKIITQEALR
jgi:hypothetical protein